MPPEKKTAEKGTAKPAPIHDEGKDLRRAHEHQGRVEILQSALGKNVSDVETLVNLAEQELASSNQRDAADLFRAAEHLSFGYLASSKSAGDLHPKLSESITQEFKHKLDKAEEHWKESDALSQVYKKSVDGAKKAFDEGAYRKALELARAAEALAHVHLHNAKKS